MYADMLWFVSKCAVSAVKGAVGYTIVWKLQRSTQGKAWERKGVSPHY